VPGDPFRIWNDASIVATSAALGATPDAAALSTKGTRESGAWSW
jgi:hypothetical protein